MHAFFDEMFTLYLKKKGKIVPFLSHLIYSFTVYIVNNAVLMLRIV